MADAVRANTKRHITLGLTLVGLDRMDMEFRFGPSTLASPRSVHWLPTVQCPVMILHGSEDTKVPTDLSLKLLERTKRSKMDVTRVVLQGLGVNHNFVTVYKGLGKLVTSFWEGRLEMGQTVVIASQSQSGETKQ